MQEEAKTKEETKEQEQEQKQEQPKKPIYYAGVHYGYYNSGRRRYERRKFHGKRGL